MSKKKIEASVFQFPIREADIDRLVESDVDRLVDDVIARSGMRVEAIEHGELGRGVAWCFTFAPDHNTTTGVTLEIMKKGLANVIIPPLASATDISVGIYLLKELSAVSPAGDDSIQDYAKLEKDLRDKAHETALKFIKELDVYTIIYGAFCPFRILGNWLHEQYPDADDERLACIALENFCDLQQSYRSLGHFGEGDVQEPDSDDGEDDGEKYHVTFLTNRTALGFTSDRFAVAMQSGVKIVDCEDFFEAAKGNANIRRYDDISFLVNEMNPEDWETLCEKVEGDFLPKRRTFLMRWNPAISSFKLDQYRDTLEKYGECFGMSWSIRDWQEARVGDVAFMLREGDGVNPGILYRGEFVSEPYEDDDWRGSKRKTRYIDMDCWGAVSPDGPAAIPTDILEAEISRYNWRIGHSGELLPDDVASELERLWSEYTMAQFDDDVDGDYDDGDDIDTSWESDADGDESFKADPPRGFGVITDDAEGLIEVLMNSKPECLYEDGSNAVVSGNSPYFQIRAYCINTEVGYKIVDFSPYVVNVKPTSTFKLLGIQEYSNGMEAILTVERYGTQLRFYDAGYLMHKEEYVVGGSYQFALSALSGRAEAVPESDLKIKLNKESSERMGVEIPKGEDCTILYADDLVCLLQTDNAYPNVGSFQSPTQSRGRSMTIFDSKFYELDIKLRLGDPVEDEEDVTIPMLVKADNFDGKPSKSTPIRGVLYLQGQLV